MIYTARTHTTGGRENGVSRRSDGRLYVKLSFPSSARFGTNKRVPGSGCAALEGINRIHAILGTSPSCIAVHPSDVAVAMTALDAKVETLSPTRNGAHNSSKRISQTSWGGASGRNRRKPGELITAVALPTPPNGGQAYRKVRDRASYAFALISVAVAGDRIALGGVARKPWRTTRAEAALKSGATASAAAGSSSHRPRALAATISRFLWRNGSSSARSPMRK
jgi:CO/xanthine dehydrogenase FAD-binding subunit